MHFMHICHSGTARRYPGRFRGTTFGRDRTTSARVARSSPSGFLSPTAIAVTGTPLLEPVEPVVAAVIGAAPGAPDIAGVAMYAGIDPCQVGGTAIAPTNRAVPRPAEATARHRPAAAGRPTGWR